MESFAQHLFPLACMLAGVGTHILKKAMKLSWQAQSDPDLPAFDLSDYLAGHPYQTALTFIAGFGAYLMLMDSGSVPDLSAAFFAGVAANSLGDIAPGDR
jgi:hypothetical protein